MPLQGIPKKRLFILAGAENESMLPALRNTQPEGILLSFLKLRDKKQRWERWLALREKLDTWRHYRYLDSGVFTFIKRQRQGVGMTSDQIRPVFEDYCAFLKEHRDDFSWVIDFDLDSVTVDGSPPPGLGVELTRLHRKELKKIVGKKLLPVWHRAAGFSAWEELIADYDYVAIGPDFMDRKSLDVQGLVQLAHAKDVNVTVHGLMVGTFNTMAAVPYDTADATNWQTPVRYGSYNGVKYSERRPITTEGELARAHQLKERVRALGYDPALLIDGTPTEKLEINIRLIQQEQERIQW